MGLTSAYLVATSRLEEFFTTLRQAQAPEKFTLSFLRDLGFSSSNERMIPSMLKALGFLDESSAPTERYFAFLDDNRWQIVLAEGIREAYADLFQLNRNANQMERSEIIGKLKSLTRGQYSEKVIANMARTFEALSALANFSVESTAATPAPELPPLAAETNPTDTPDTTSDPIVPKPGTTTAVPNYSALTYRIELILPSTRDKAVYDSLFRSLREHLG